MLKTRGKAAFLLFLTGMIFNHVVIAQQNMEGTGQGKPNIAVINLKNSAGVATGESELISDRLRGDLFNTGKVNVMERDQMQEILKEQGFQASGACNDESCLVQMGQLLGVQSLVTGSLGKVGSMFLVNVRMIDVKTAKIVKVVSVDIRGEIEDVVGKLKDIAEQLVSSAPAVKKAPEPLVQAKAEEPNVEPKKEGRVEQQSQKKEIAEESRALQEPMAPEIPEDQQALRNKNRSGLQLSVNMFVGPMNEASHMIYYDYSGNKIDEEEIDLDSAITSFSHSAFLNIQLLFALKVGRMFSIDVGTGFVSGRSTYGPIGYLTVKNDLAVFSFNTGFNFVKRWHPFKLNIGLTIDGNILTYTMNEHVENPSTFYAMDSSATWVGVNGSLGLKIGGEYLMGEHIGLGADMRFCRSRFETMAENHVDGNGNYDVSRITELPPIGLGVAFHYYY